VAILDPRDNIKSRRMMCGQDEAFAFKQAKYSFVKDVTSHVGVNSTKRIIHQYNIGIRVDGSCDIKALLPTARDGNTSLANLSLVTW
jgi:hypothetical protein